MSDADFRAGTLNKVALDIIDYFSYDETSTALIYSLSSLLFGEFLSFYQGSNGHGL